MPGSVSLFIWGLVTALELLVVVCSVYRKSFLNYFFLNFYMLLSVLSSVLRFIILRAYGYRSDQYMYSYYYTDALLTITLFIALISLYSLVLGELHISRYLRLAAVVLLLGTALFSYGVVEQSANRLSTAFAYQLSQNLYFVGLVLTYILWGAVLKLRETRIRLVQFVLALGLYFSAYAASYALINLAEKYTILQYLSPLLGCFLPISWAYTLFRHSEESRLQTAQLVAVQR